jgi:FkbM family methyltransferase
MIKRVLKRLFSLIGLRVTRTGTGILGSINKSATSPEDRFKFGPSAEDKFKWIQDMSIKTVIDVGAHAGESAMQFHELFPNAKIYSFEPLHDCFVKLNAAMKNVPNFKSFNLALGDKEGTLDIHRSEWSQSSSLLKMANLHKEAFPFSSGEILETIQISTIDNVAKELDLEDNVLLKIDVQGYEHKVIMGSRNILNRVKVIIIETSFHELYEGQPLFAEIYELLNGLGFVYSGSWGELKSPLDGAPFQQDSIFIRSRANSRKE